MSTLHIEQHAGHPHSLTLEQRIKVLLIKQLVGESNRMFAGLMIVFSLLEGIYHSKLWRGFTPMKKWPLPFTTCLY